jgi:inhibitor of cysteine peptidase
MTTRLAVAAVLIAMSLLAPACTKYADDTFVSTGTVVFLSLEGGFYGIKGDDGRNYDPMNLPEDFRKNGLRIRFEAKTLTDRAGFHMWGKIVEIKNVEKL